jgi:hypothetical protein
MSRARQGFKSMADYNSVRSNWWALLNWHLKENGTRPDGTPDAMGKVWDDAEFALACGVGDATRPEYAARTVQNWLDEGRAIVSTYIARIEKALMGVNPVYASWRLDLRAAHRDAQKRKKNTSKNLKQERKVTSDSQFSDASTDIEGFALAVREGLMMKIRGRTYLTSNFFEHIWRGCSDPKTVSAVTNAVESPQCSDIIGVLLISLIISALRKQNWTQEEFDAVLNEARYQLFRIIRSKAYDVGILSFSNERYGPHDDALDSFTPIMFDRLPHDATKVDVYRQAYESWKDVVRVAVESMPQEDPRYVEILTIFMYASSLPGMWESWLLARDRKC